MTEWRVHLQGEQVDVQELKEILLGYDRCIIEEGGNFYLTSKAWDKLQEAREVQRQAKDFIQLLENAVCIDSEVAAPLTIGGIVRIDEDGHRQDILIADPGRLTTRGPARVRFIAAGTCQNPTTTEHQVIKVLRVSAKNPLVVDALRFLRKGDWVSLYKAYEIVNDAIGAKREIVSRRWIPKASINRFTQTAQSREALGDDARHASRRFTPPKATMSICEAKTIIRTLIQKWIDSL
jgi:hypothetical protein